MNIAFRLVITGRVQGVFYRESMRMQAEKLGVTGWVQNRADGAVEAHVQGTPEAVDALVAWAHVGPPAARVNDVHISEVNPGGFTSFERRHAA